ncbi:UNVERIFIED_CONTAM: hypothetical protein Sangu_1107100 [Sesamum angustifolium]|uniref:Serine incorporator n=1 Tax=Sesamum angustifolium TaxID=2727405 RepID=A0AAW2NZU6_9LAMI
MSCLASCCASLTCGLCTSVASGITKRSARIAYCGLFGVSLIVSWILREVAAPLLKHFSWINTSDNLSKEWFQIQAVLRVSLGNFLFFGILALIMIGVKDQNDRRDSWHHGGWIAKMLIWALLIILMFFLPNVIITVYGVLSKFGAGLFLLVQVIILLDATHSWNDSWVAKDEKKWYLALLAVSVACYLASFTISGLLFIWFNPSGHDCGLNVFFLVMSIILALCLLLLLYIPRNAYINVSVSSLSLILLGTGDFSQQVNGSLLPASVISVYCAYLCYTGLSSEPRDYVCNGLHNKSKAVSTSTLILGMLTTVLSVLYSALRAGSSTTFLSPPSSPRAGDKKPLLESDELESGKGKNGAEARPVSYSYTFFHLIFALASMYSAMLLSGWTSSSENPNLIDVGWTSVWVRICTEWLVLFALFVISFVAFVVFFEICCGQRSRRCGKKGCKGLKKAMEFDLQLQGEDMLRIGNGNKAVKDVDELPWKGGSEDNPDYECLRAELRKMAPPNGRAVLLFRDKCGCPVSKLEGFCVSLLPGVLTTDYVKYIALALRFFWKLCSVKSA